MSKIFNDTKFIHLPPNSAAATTYTLAAGTSSVNSGVVNIQSHGMGAEVIFLITLGTITATGTGAVKLQGSNDNSAWSDIAGTNQAWDDTMSDKMIGVSIIRPTYQYYRAVFSRATANSVINGLLALVGSVRKAPIAQSVAAGQFITGSPEIFASPIAGTA